MLLFAVGPGYPWRHCDVMGAGGDAVPAKGVAKGGPGVPMTPPLASPF